MPEQLTKRRKYINRLTALKLERSSWDSHARELAENIEPRRSRFNTTERNRGEKKNDKIINNTPIRAKSILQSGIQAGLSNISRPWFRLLAPTPELGEVAAVKEFLHAVEEALRDMMARSNIYNAFHTLYGDLATFGTALLYIEEDDQETIRCWVFPFGSYCIALDSKGRLEAVYRETSLTVGQLVAEYGLEKCSSAVKTAYEANRVDEPINIVQVIEPNRDYQPGKLGPVGKKYSSCWFEQTADDDAGMLRESGYDENPCMAPRWDVTAEDTYGSSPGMEALGDCKALQLYELRKSQAIEKIVNPPMVGPSSLAAGGQRISLLPGDVTYVDALSAASTFKPAHEIQPVTITVFQAAIAETERHIKDAFYANLFLALLQSDGSMTAREVEERHEEKLLQLGPTTHRLGNELHDPVIDRLLAIGFRHGLFPAPPPEMQGLEVKIEYISSLAQAQKLIGTLAIERLVAFVLQLATTNPDIVDVVDLDQAVQEYANALGVPPALVRSDDVIVALRNAKAKAKAAVAQQQQLMAGTQAAKNLSETSLEGDNALNRMLAANGSPAVRN